MSDFRNALRTTPHPLVLEIPARNWLAELSRREGRRVTLADVPEEPLEAFREKGFHAVWLMGAWRTSPLARRMALSHPALLHTYETLLPDWQIRDVEGSPYALFDYEASPSIGGDSGLDFFRRRLQKLGLGLVLDFVGNHFARDHRWTAEHPDRFVQGTVRDLAQTPSNWYAHLGEDGEDRVFAHGRDPHFEGWSDTVQVDIRNRGARDAHIDTLRRLARRCDGLRCDVAMLLLRNVFRSTWGTAAGEPESEFWEEAIVEVRRENPDFVFIAEAYWGLESRLIELGFDFSYDKAILDALAAQDLAALRRLQSLPFAERRRRVHFLENHDEIRAMTSFGKDRLAPALLFAATLPGMRFFHHGQIEGRRIRVPVQLARTPEEVEDPWCRDLHEQVFSILRERALHEGEWSPWAPSPERSERAGILGNRWAFEDGEWIVLANFGSIAESAEIRPSRGAAHFEVQRVFESPSSSRPWTRNENDFVSVPLEPGQACVLRVAGQQEPIPKESSRS
jgi:hypothetical protein